MAPAASPRATISSGGAGGAGGVSGYFVVVAGGVGRHRRQRRGRQRPLCRRRRCAGPARIATERYGAYGSTVPAAAAAAARPSPMSAAKASSTGPRRRMSSPTTSDDVERYRRLAALCARARESRRYHHLRAVGDHDRPFLVAGDLEERHHRGPAAWRDDAGRHHQRRRRQPQLPDFTINAGVTATLDGLVIANGYKPPAPPAAHSARQLRHRPTWRRQPPAASSIPVRRADADELRAAKQYRGRRFSRALHGGGGGGGTAVGGIYVASRRLALISQATTHSAATPRSAAAVAKVSSVSSRVGYPDYGGDGGSGRVLVRQ